MNPRSRMVIFVVLALASPALLPSLSSAADTSNVPNSAPDWLPPVPDPSLTPAAVPGNPAWMQVASKSDGKTYYVPASELTGLAEKGFCQLYAQAGAKKALENIRLYGFKNPNTQMSYAIVFKNAPKPPSVPSAPKSASPVSNPLAPPAGMAPQAWNLLRGEIWQLIKKNNPAEYQKIREVGANQKVIQAMREAIRQLRAVDPKKKIDAQGVYGVLTTAKAGGKSALQVLLDDTTAAPAANPTAKPADQKSQEDAGGTDPAGQSGAKDGNPVTILTQKLIKSPKGVGGSIAARIADYIVNGNDKGFISSDLRSKDDVMVRISSTPAAWVAEKVKQHKAAEVAQLYFVMGAGDQAPSWLADNAALAGALTDTQTQRTTLFIQGMQPWTQAALDEKGVGQCSQADVVSWVHRFLGTEKSQASYALSAVQVSSAILNNSVVRKELGEIAKHIQGNAEGVAVPETGAGTGNQPIAGSAKGFDFNGLFRDGAVIKQVTLQNGNSATISIKMYTVRENGALVNKVGIFDISNPADTFGQKFSIPAGTTKSTFALDDRVAGMSKYTLRFTPNGSDTQISFSRAGSDDPQPASLSDLYAKRAQQAIAAADITKVGSESYYVLGQGGAKGSLLFFRKKSLDSGGDLVPEMAAEVNQRAADGRNQNIPYTVGRALWTADGKSAPYHLEFDPKRGYWEVKDLAGDPDPVTAPAVGTSSAPTGGQAGGAASGSGASGQPTDVAAIRANLRAGDYELNPAVFQSLNQKLKDQGIEIWSYTKAGKPPLGYWHVWIFPAELSSARNMPMPAPPDIPLGETPDELHVIGGHFIAITRSYETLFYDLDRPQKVEMKDDKPQNHPFEQVGKVSKNSINLSDSALLKSAMDLGKFPLKGKTDRDVESNLKAVMKNRQEGEKYTITAGMDSGTLSIYFGEHRLDAQFWPTISLNSDVGHPDTQGPGHAFDFGGFGSDDGKPFVDPLDIKGDPATGNPDETVTKEVEAEDHSAILYVNSDKSRWYLIYKFQLDDGTKKVLRSNAGWAFASSQKERPVHPAVAIQVKGLKGKVEPNGEFRLAGDAQKGLWYAVKSKTISSQNATKLADNCLGPVIWWGMDEKAAGSACKNDSL